MPIPQLRTRKTTSWREVTKSGGSHNNQKKHLGLEVFFQFKLNFNLTLQGDGRR